MRDFLVARSIARRPITRVCMIGALMVTSISVIWAAPPAQSPPVRVNETIVRPDPDAGDANFRRGDGAIDPRIAAMEERFKTRKIDRQPNAPQQIVTVDIGTIAVIEDDGTLILPNGPDLVTDTVAILDAFYTTHSDVYDGVVVFTSSGFPADVDPEAGFAFFFRALQLRCRAQ